MRTGPAIIVCTAACAGGPVLDEPTPQPAPAPAPTSQPAPTVPLTFAIAPTLRENLDGAGLTAWLDAFTEEPTTLTVRVDDGVTVREWDLPGPATEHSHLLMGFKADRDHTVQVTARDGDRVAEAADLAWRSAPLPADAPSFHVTGPGTGLEPGVTMLHVGNHLWMVDATGEPVWYRQASTFVHQVVMTERGTLLWQVAKSHLEELELSGQVMRSFRHNRSSEPPGSIEIDQQAVHHDVVEMPSGNLLTLGIEDRVFFDYPASEDDPVPLQASAPVAGDVILEIDPAGVVVSSWSMLDRLDPRRIGYNGLFGDYWDENFGYPHIHDWSHGNSVFYDADRDEIIVSLRHQDAVVAIGHSTGLLAWIFAPNANWPPTLASRVLRPERPVDVPAYHQHAAKITAAGTLILFDNGNNRASAYEPRVDAEDNYSRCLEVAIDHAAGTWTTVWEWGAQRLPPLYASSLGDCDFLPQTTNRLITFGHVDDVTLPPTIVLEVDADGEVLWELTMTSDEAYFAPNVFRAERLTGVVPGY